MRHTTRNSLLVASLVVRQNLSQRKCQVVAVRIFVDLLKIGEKDKERMSVLQDAISVWDQMGFLPSILEGLLAICYINNRTRWEAGLAIVVSGWEQQGDVS